MPAAVLEWSVLLKQARQRAYGVECTQMRTLAALRNAKQYGQGGAELVEMAVILPILLTMLIGVFWAARAYNIYETITRAAREGARVAVAPSCSVCGSAAPSVSSVENAVLNSLTASSMDTTKITFPSCSGNLSTTICYQRDIALNTSSPNEFGVSVGLTYPFQFMLPFTTVNVSTIHITTTVEMREEN